MVPNFKRLTITCGGKKQTFFAFKLQSDSDTDRSKMSTLGKSRYTLASEKKGRVRECLRIKENFCNWEDGPESLFLVILTFLGNHKFNS